MVRSASSSDRSWLIERSKVTTGECSAAITRCSHQGRIVDRPAQLGGVLVIAPDGSVRYAHMSEDASDNAPIGEILAAARAIRPHATPGP